MKKNKKMIIFRIIETIPLLLLILFLFLFVFCLSKVDKSSYEYADFLKGRMVLSCSIFASMLFLFWIVSAVSFKKAGIQLIRYWIILVWLLFVCFAFFYGFSMLQKQYLDISKEDFVVYEGEFEKDQTRSFIFLKDGKKTRLENVKNQTFIEKGQYKGRIIYSKRTKYVLDIAIN